MANPSPVTRPIAAMASFGVSNTALLDALAGKVLTPGYPIADTQFPFGFGPGY